MIFCNTFSKAANALTISAVVGLDMLETRKKVFVALELQGQFLYTKTAKILFFPKTRDKNLPNEPHMGITRQKLVWNVENVIIFVKSFLMTKLIIQLFS